MGATNTLNLCLNSQTRIDTLFTDSSNPVDKTKDTLGTKMAVESAENTQGFSAVPIQTRNLAVPTSTSNRKVAVSGRVKNCPTVTTGEPTYCHSESAETSDLIDTEVQFGDPNYVQFTINRALYRDTCDDANGQYAGVLAYKLAEAAGEILKKENNSIINEFLSNTTTYFDGTDSSLGGGSTKTIPLYGSTVPRTPQPGNLFLIINEMVRKGYDDAVPMAVGGTGLSRWMYDANFFVGNTDGADISKVPGGLRPYVDYKLDSIANATLAGNYLAAWIPGHVQAFKYLDFAEGSTLRRSSGTVTYTTIKIRGEEFDLVVKDEDCDHDLHITLQRYYKPWVVPSSFFSTSCGGQMTTLLYNLDCADTTCDNIFLPADIIT